MIFRQISDARSGYATLEKDPPGSLTPMLGDKKVCYSEIVLKLNLVFLLKLSSNVHLKPSLSLEVNSYTRATLVHYCWGWT